MGFKGSRVRIPPSRPDPPTPLIHRIRRVREPAPLVVGGGNVAVPWPAGDADRLPASGRARRGAPVARPSAPSDPAAPAREGRQPGPLPWRPRASLGGEMAAIHSSGDEHSPGRAGGGTSSASGIPDRGARREVECMAKDLTSMRPGTRAGPNETVRPIGVGGRGGVYRVRAMQREIRGGVAAGPPVSPSGGGAA